MQADEYNVVHSYTEGTNSPSLIRSCLHGLLAHIIHEAFDPFCNDLGQLCLTDHATLVSVVFRRDLSVVRLVPWPLQDYQSYTDEARENGIPVLGYLQMAHTT